MGPAESSGNGPDEVCRQDFNVGDRVMGVTRFGAFTSHLNAKVKFLLPKFGYAGAGVFLQVYLLLEQCLLQMPFIESSGL